MIQVLGALAIVAYGGYKLYQAIEKETEKELDKERGNENESNNLVSKTKLLLEAKEIQKELARLHEIYLTTSKLTAVGEMKNLDIRVDNLPLEDKIKEQEKKLMEISLKLKNFK